MLAPAAERHGRSRGEEMKTIATLAGYELRASLRNRWFLLYALAFSVLAVALSSLSLSGAGMFGFAGFGRTAASLINLVLLIVPLMGLTVGAQSLAGEREQGTLAYLLAQPVSRAEVLLGKLMGLGSALLAALLLGFGLSAAIIAWQGGVVETGRYGALVGFSLLLALVTLSLGIFISAWSRSNSVAIGLALFMLALINPLQVFKIATVNSLRASLEILGPAGIYATRTYGDALVILLVSVLVGWIILSIIAAYLRFRIEADL